MVNQLFLCLSPRITCTRKLWRWTMLFGALLVCSESQSLLGGRPEMLSFLTYQESIVTKVWIAVPSCPKLMKPKRPYAHAYMTVLLLKLMPLQQPSLQVLPKHVTQSNMHTQSCTLSSGKCRRVLQRRQPMLNRNIRSPKIMPKLVSAHVMLGHHPRVLPFLIPTCYMMWLRLVTVGLVGTAPAVLVLPMVVVSERPNVLVIAVMLSFFVMDFLFVRNVVKL